MRVIARRLAEVTSICFSKSFAQMSRFIEQLTDAERDSLRRVHQAIRNNVQRSTLLSIRNEIILNSDKQFGFIEAFDDILKVNKVADLGNDDEAWTCLTKTAEKYDAERAGTNSRKEWKKWKTNVRHTLFISMQWPSETLTRYGWNTENFNRDGLSYMYNCAFAWPNFEKDFIPQVNLVRWLKHCSALSALEAKKTKEHDFAPKGEEFAVKDLHSLSDLRKGIPVSIYGREVTLETAGQLKHEIRRWTENQDGVVPVGGKWLDLKEYRPEHWNIYLLKFNENGLLVRRERFDEVPTPRRDGILSPPSSMRQTASVKPDSTNAAASYMRSSVSGNVADRAVINSDDDSTAASVVEMTTAIATCSATPHTQHDSGFNENYDTSETRHSDADSTSSHSTGPSAVKGTPIASVETDLANEAICVRRSARNRQKRVAQVFLEDGEDSRDEDHSNDQGTSDRRPDAASAQDKDSDFECLSNGQSGDFSQANDAVERPPTSIDGTGDGCLDTEQESTRQSTQERDGLSHKTTIETEVTAGRRGITEASTNVLPEQVDEVYVAGVDNVTADLSEVESWLIGQNSSLFVGDSPTDASHSRSEAPGASPPASRVSQEDDEGLEDEALPINIVRTPANNRDKDASAGSNSVTFPPPATHEWPETSRVRTISPQPGETQGANTTSPMTAEKNSSGATNSSSTSESSLSELASWPHTDNSNVARTVQGLTPTSSGRSSSRDDSSPSETSLSDINAREAWLGYNVRDLSSPLFAKMGHRPYRNLPLASDALAAMLPPDKAAHYSTLMRPSVSIPYMPHASIEGKGVQEECGTGYGSLFGRLPGYLDDNDVGCSDDSDGASQDSLDPPHTHLGPRPEDCACHICDNVGPLLERIRIEASSDQASPSCRARGRWFGSAKWASAIEVFDAEEGGPQSDHEVIYVDRASFREMAYAKMPFSRPIVIKGYQHGQDVYGVEALQKGLEDSYGNLEVTMTNTLTGVPTLVGMEEFLERFSIDQWSIGSSTPRGTFGTQPPDFLSYDRFRLLQSAVTRASCHPVDVSSVGAACENVAHSLCVNGGLSFNRIESSGAFSGPCLGSLGGTWLHVLQGRRLCAFIPRERLTTSFRDGFVRNGLEWEPRNEQRLVLLEPDDVLVLPADIVCAQLAVNAGVSFEGSFWDERDWGRYFTAAQWAAVNPTRVTAEVPRCATRLALHGLKSIAENDPQRFELSDPLAHNFLKNDRSGVFEEVVMAGRCSPGRTTVGFGVRGWSGLGTAGNRRKSDAQDGEGDERPGKRLCIREAARDVS